MSRENNILRGITNQDLKTMVRKALANGFLLGEMTGTTHCYVIWPKTGEKVGFGTTVSDSNYWKDFARQCETVSGGEVVMIEKHKHGKVRHKVNRHTYIDTRSAPMQEALARRVEDINKEYRLLALEFSILAMGGEEGSTYDHINQAMKVIQKMAKLEETLKTMHQPIPVVEGLRPVTYKSIEEINA